MAEILAISTGYRVSVFDADLTLIADSDLGPGPLDTVPDRSRRTEVVGALRRVSASSRRTSALDERDYLFSATRVYWRGAPVVLRFGSPSASIGEAASRVGRRVALAALAAGLVAFLFVDRAVGGVNRSLADVRRLLARLGAGQPPGPRIKLPRGSFWACSRCCRSRPSARWCAIRSCAICSRPP